MEKEIFNLKDGIDTIDRCMSIYDNKIKHVENYIDKYVPIQIQSMISKSIQPVITNESQSHRFTKHNEKLMTKLHEEILNDEGIANLEMSMEILSGEASHVVRKSKNKHAKFNPGLSASTSQNMKHKSSNSMVSRHKDSTLSENDTLLQENMTIEKLVADPKTLKSTNKHTESVSIPGMNNLVNF